MAIGNLVDFMLDFYELSKKHQLLEKKKGKPPLIRITIMMFKTMILFIIFYGEALA